MAGGMDPVVIGEAPLGVEAIVRIAGGAPVELTAAAEARVVASRDVVEEQLARPEPVYGLNTGLGHMRDQRLTDEELRDYQELTVRMHDGGLGPPLPVPVGRAALAVRLAGFVRGGAGVRLITARAFAAMLNAGVHPIVPSNGSVGASDLMHMAAIAQVLIGGGSAEYLGTRLPGADPMRRGGGGPGGRGAEGGGGARGGP